nr:suppressor protein SRP40-like [Rhipicephalus microplus]
MSTSTTQVNVTTTTITRATSKAELVDENPDLAAECVQQLCTDGKPVDPQPLPHPLLANYETMLTKLSPETARKQELLPGPPTERVFDRDESGSVTVDVRKMLDEENVDNDKLYQHKLEGTEVRKLEEKQAMKEAFQEANTFDNVIHQKTLAKGQVTKKRTLVETASAKRITTRRENEAAKLDQVGCTIKRNIEEAGNAEENVEKSEKQLENIEKVTCNSQRPPCGHKQQLDVTGSLQKAHSFASSLTPPSESMASASGRAVGSDDSVLETRLSKEDGGRTFDFNGTRMNNSKQSSSSNTDDGSDSDSSSTNNSTSSIDESSSGDTANSVDDDVSVTSRV